MSKIEESLETKKKKEYQEGGIEWQTSKGGGVGQIYILFLPDCPTCLLLSSPQAFLDPGFSTISDYQEL